MKKQITLNIIGIVIGIAIIITGVMFLSTPALSFETDSASPASFGADFYTYQYEATKIVARNTAVTANNIRELGSVFAGYFGYAFIFTGLLVVLHYIKLLLTPINSTIAIEEKANQENKTEENTVINQ